jgi:hypothetical protein
MAPKYFTNQQNLCPKLVQNLHRGIENTCQNIFPLLFSHEKFLDRANTCRQWRSSYGDVAPGKTDEQYTKIEGPPLFPY